MAKKPKHKLPKTLHVALRDEGDGGFFIYEDGVDVFEDGEAVGTYTLTSVGTKRVRHTVE
jgi:hypothetical protein